MANYRAIANGNWSSGATWDGGSVPPNAAGHNIYSNNCTVTIDQNVDVALITNASVTASFVGGGTSAAAGGGFSMSSAFDITGLLNPNSGSQLLTITAASGTININSSSVGPGGTTGAIRHNGACSISLNNATITGSSGANWVNISNNSSGNITFNNCTIVANGSSGGAYPIQNTGTSTGTLTFNTCTLTAGNNGSYAVGNLGAGNIKIGRAHV